MRIANEILMVLRSNKKLANEISIEECIGTDKEGNSMTFADVIPSDEPDIADVLSDKMDALLLYDAMNKALKPSEAKILCLRYGLNGCERITQQEIADMMGISRSYISRIEKKAIKKLMQVIKK